MPTLDQECRRKYEEMYQRLTHAVMLTYQHKHCFCGNEKFPGLSSMIVGKQHRKRENLKSILEISL